MTKIDFNNFLMDKHAEDYQGVDDDMPDDFENWLSQLNTDDIIKYADEYGEEQEEKYFRKDFYIQSIPDFHSDNKNKRVYKMVVKHNPLENRVFNIGKESFGWTSGGLVLFTIGEFIKHIRGVKGSNIYTQWPKDQLKD